MILDGRLQLKNPFQGRRPSQGSLGGNTMKKNSPPRRVIDLPCWQINDSSPEKNQQNTNGLVAGPGWKIEADE